MKSRLTISIVNWNTREHLARCLESLLAACNGAWATIVVVDNASSDGSAAMVQEQFPSVRLLALDENIGFAAANNLAIRESDGEYVLILNPDIYASPNSVSELVQFLDANPDVAGVGAALVGGDGQIQTEFYRRAPTRLQILLFYTGLYHINWRIPALKHRFFDFAIRGNEPVPVDQLPGACCLVRRSVVEDVGLMDPDYFIWFEDVDWCYRMRQANQPLLVLPSVRMLHAGGASFNGWTMDRKVWQFSLSLFRFLCKHRLESLLRWSSGVVLTDLWLKEWGIRIVRRLPFGSRLALPGSHAFGTLPDTLRELRTAIRNLIAGYRDGELVRFKDQGGHMVLHQQLEADGAASGG